MANLYDTRLECLSNYELLKVIDPKKIIKKSQSEFRFSIGDELVFESRNCTMHEDIITLSEQFPNAIFLARYYDFDEQLYNNSPAECFRYENGKDKFLGYEPLYAGINHEKIIIDFGEDVYHRLWKRIRKYLFRLDQTKESLLDDQLRVDQLEHHYDDCVTSYVTIHAEYENYKLSVDKCRNSELKFHGYKRSSPSEEWQEINEPEKGKSDDNES